MIWFHSICPKDLVYVLAIAGKRNTTTIRYCRRRQMGGRHDSMPGVWSRPSYRDLSCMSQPSRTIARRSQWSYARTGLIACLLARQQCVGAKRLRLWFDGLRRLCNLSVISIEAYYIRTIKHCLGRRSLFVQVVDQRLALEAPKLQRRPLGVPVRCQ